jgi:hypothetical protein
MPLSNSVMRRYTPPTCTLEVLAQSSPLSKWMNKSVLKQLRFELRFDDPRLPEEQRIAIRGDRDQLEALCAAVTTYVQEFLEKSPDQFWQSYSTSDTDKADNGIEIQDNHNSLSRISTLGKPFNTQIPKTDIYIESQNHLSHNLHLGTLAPTTGAVVQLSLLQLFDLATACDEYCADVMALPNLDTTQRRTRTSIPAWAPVAAVIAIGVGLAPITLQYANRTRQQTATNQASKPEIALQQTPGTVLTTPLLLPTLQDTLPSLSGLPPTPLPGSSTSLQIPNSSVLPTLQATSNPNVPPSSQVLPNSPIASGQIPSNLGNPTATQSSSRFSFPSTPLPQSGSTFTIPGTITPKLPSATGIKSPTTLQNPGSIALQPNLPLSRTTTQTKPGSSIAIGRLPSSSFPPLADPSTLPPTIPALPPLSELPKTTSRTSNTTARNSVTSSNGSNNIPTQTIPPLAADNPSPLIDRLREARNVPQVANASNRTATNSTIFDTPQIAEARDILRSRWQPPSALKQTLEYSLVVGVDGTIERIMPLNRAARTYIDNTGMPLIGERFVSPNRNGQSVRIRAVFSPDGKVQTFPENE